jgi:hypothetical protein
MLATELLLHMVYIAEGFSSFKYAAVESAMTDDDASYRVHFQVEAKERRSGKEGVA